MLRLACLVVLVLAPVAAWTAPAALAAGCEVLVDPAERADCVARQQARVAARAQVRSEVQDRPVPDGERSAAWQRALAEADGVHARDVLEPRPIAAIGGLAWFALALRARRRRATRRSGRS